MEEKYILGLDINESEAQICFYDRKKKDAVSFTPQPASEKASFPACLAYIQERNLWKIGDAAQEAASQGALFIGNIISKCSSSRKIEVMGRSFAPEFICAQFLLQMLKLAEIEKPGKEIISMTITVPEINTALARVIEDAVRLLDIKPNRVRLQDYSESFYYHTFYQKTDIFRGRVGMYYFPDREQVEYSQIDVNKKTRPKLVRAERLKTGQLPLEDNARNTAFAKFITDTLTRDDYSAIFLVGKGFSLDWCKSALELLCRSNCKVFYGDNLFAKGACFAAYEQVGEKRLGDYLFVGKDLVKKNIGIDVLKNGSLIYHSLITAGIHWYEAASSCEFILDGDDSIIFKVSNMEDGERTQFRMDLEGLPVRPPKTTRVKVKVRFESPEECSITVEDLGFGELFPSSGLSWTEKL